MAQSTLILGGARSGKSTYAEHCAQAVGGELIYIATATAGDREMEQRIAAHQARRGQEWRTLEETTALPQALAGCDAPGVTVLVDCLTLWLTNLMLLENLDDAAAAARFQELAGLLPRLSSRIFLVSNEVGLGLVPGDALSRRFRDLSGLMNQTLAAACDQVVFTAAGLPLALKGAPPFSGE